MPELIFENVATDPENSETEIVPWNEEDDHLPYLAIDDPLITQEVREMINARLSTAEGIELRIHYEIGVRIQSAVEKAENENVDSLVLLCCTNLGNLVAELDVMYQQSVKITASLSFATPNDEKVELEIQKMLPSVIDHINTIIDLLSTYSQDDIQMFIDKVLGDALDARDLITFSNISRVVFIAKRYSFTAIPIQDLIQEGVLGMLENVGKYRINYRKDENPRANIGSYLHYWIEARILRYLRENKEDIKIPSYMQDILNQYYRIEKELDGQGSQELIFSSLIFSENNKRVKRSKAPLSRINELKFKARVLAALKVSTVLQSGDQLRTYTYGDDPADGKDAYSTFDREELFEDADFEERLALEIDIARGLTDPIYRLPTRSVSILVMRYGEGLTLEETAKQIVSSNGSKGMSRERLRQLAFEALRRLRRANGPLYNYGTEEEEVARKPVLPNQAELLTQYKKLTSQGQRLIQDDRKSYFTQLDLYMIEAAKKVHTVGFSGNWLDKRSAYYSELEALLKSNGYSTEILKHINSKEPTLAYTYTIARMEFVWERYNRVMSNMSDES